MGQIFAGQGQAKPVLLQFANIRVEKEQEIIEPLLEVLRDVFLDIPQDMGLQLEFTNKAELKIWREKKGIGGQPLYVIGLCTNAWTKKDYILTIGIRNESGAPFPLNMALLRHLLINLNKKEIKYEIW